MNVLHLFSLPLLTKELIEQAHRKRTYVLRVIYAVILYGIALWYYGDLSRGGSAAELVNLGRGRALFACLFVTQFFAILLLMPAITCGALTVEKEKDTLALLLLTKLRPWTIVFEKLLSRVFAMSTYQLLSLPLFAIVYGIGGVDLPELIIAVASLTAFTLIVASVSILCSTWFRTTSEAFVMAYVALSGLGCVCSPFWMIIAAVMNSGIRAAGSEPPSPWLMIIEALFLSTTVGIFAAMISAVLLMVASNVLVQRAFVPPRNILLEQFQRADRFFNDLNQKTTGGIVLVQDRESLPLFQPITWRETRKKSLGTFRYQFRILMFLLAPLILVIAAAMNGGGTNEVTSPFRGFPIFFWIVSVICVTIHSTGVIPAERIRQSLDVLLVAPLTPAEIVLEKLSGVRRLIKILTVPFVILVVFQAIWTGYVVGGSRIYRNSDFWLELVSTSLTALVYMPLIMWVGFQFGLRMRTQIQALLCTFASVASACLIPLLVARFLEPSFSGSIDHFWNEVSFICEWLSPLQPLFNIRDSNAGYANRAATSDLAILESMGQINWWMLGLHFLIYGAVWALLRRNAIRAFSRIVGRLEPGAAGSKPEAANQLGLHLQ